MANPEKRFLQNLTHSGVVLGGVNALGPYSSMFFFACSVVKPLSKFVENRSHSSDASTTWTSNSSSCLRSSNFSVGNKGRINFLRSDFNDTNDTKKWHLSTYLSLSLPSFSPLCRRQYLLRERKRLLRLEDGWRMQDGGFHQNKFFLGGVTSRLSSSGAVAGTEKRALSFHKCCASSRRAENRWAHFIVTRKNIWIFSEGTLSKFLRLCNRITLYTRFSLNIGKSMRFHEFLCSLFCFHFFYFYAGTLHIWEPHV